MQLDLKHIISSKSPKLAKWLPKPILRYLIRIIHQDEINYALRNFSHLSPEDFIRSSLEYMGVGYRFEGLDQIDTKGRYLFVSNHPFGGLDGVIIAENVIRRFGGAKVVVNDLLMNMTPVAPIFIPINKHGRQKSGYAATYRDALASDLQIITFPAGLCSRRKKGVVCDLEWKPTFIKSAIEYQRDVVPIFVEGELSDFFYRLANLRTALGIKANIEMLYLVDEMFRQKGKNFVIRVGQPIPWQSLEQKGVKPAEVASQIKNIVYGLGK